MNEELRIVNCESGNENRVSGKPIQHSAFNRAGIADIDNIILLDRKHSAANVLW